MQFLIHLCILLINDLLCEFYLVIIVKKLQTHGRPKHGSQTTIICYSCEEKNFWNQNLEYISTILYTNFLINPWHFLKQARFRVPGPITYLLNNYGQKYIIIFPWNQFYENFRENNFTENINWPEHQQGVHPKGFDSCKPNVPWWQRSQLIPSTFTLHSHCPWLHSEKLKKKAFVSLRTIVLYTLHKK